ncbi:MAG: phbZ, partial [Myxococcales bacterium]|nr:phbZ [Myxococcales bacterium]
GSGGGGGGGGKPLPCGCSAAGDARGALGDLAPVLLAFAALQWRRRSHGARRAGRHVVAAFVALVVVGALAGSAHAAGQFVSDTFNGRAYKVYIPSSYANQPMPLVLMLHGCTQDPDQFATGSQMNAVAETNGFIVVYPDQPSATQQLKCWQWWDPAHQKRGGGEPAELVGLVDHVAGKYAVDGARVFTAGLSAGAAMSVILGATYPDRFDAIVVAAGIEYGAASSAQTAGTVGYSGGPDPAQQGKLAAAAMGGVARPVRVLVFHGSSDGVVAPINGEQVVAQWRATDAALGIELPAAPDTTEPMTVTGGRNFTRTRWGSWIEKITVDGMGHAWSGGAVSASYTDPKGPDASALTWSFFSVAPDNPSGGGGGGGGGNGATSAMHGGCSMSPAAAVEGGVDGAAPAAAVLIGLGLYAARKRATRSSWTRSGGSSRSLPRLA